MRELAPFLKMYTEYVKNYDNAMHLIGTWYQKQSRFAAIMDHVHVSLKEKSCFISSNLYKAMVMEYSGTAIGGPSREG